VFVNKTKNPVRKCRPTEINKKQKGNDRPGLIRDGRHKKVSYKGIIMKRQREEIRVAIIVKKSIQMFMKVERMPKCRRSTSNGFRFETRHAQGVSKESLCSISSSRKRNLSVVSVPDLEMWRSWARL